MEFFRKVILGLPEQASTFAPHVDHSLVILHIGMFVIFIVAFVFFVVALFRFRQKANPKADNNVHKWAVRSFVPDISILIFELWLIFVFGFPIWANIKEEFPSAKESLLVEMVAEQFAWNFQYAGVDGAFGKRDPKQMSSTNPTGLDSTDPAAKDDIITLNQLYVPVNKPTIVTMTSKDVIHSFFVPEFRLKQDTVPGMRIPLWFEPTKTGVYELDCSQLCGLGHYRMKGEVTVLTQEEFDSKMNELNKELTQVAS